MAVRRRFKRIPIRGDSVLVETVIETEAEVADLSMHGMGIQTQRRLKPGIPCMVTLGRNGSSMILKGTSIWERFSGWSIGTRGKVKPLFAAGIRIDTVPRDLVSSTCDAGDTSRAVRVRPAECTARLSYPEAMAVRSISYGGLMAESWNALDLDTEHVLKIRLSEAQDIVKVVGKVIFCERTKTRDDKRYHIAFEYVAIEEAHAVRLETFIGLRALV